MSWSRANSGRNFQEVWDMFYRMCSTKIFYEVMKTVLIELLICELMYSCWLWFLLSLLLVVLLHKYLFFLHYSEILFQKIKCAQHKSLIGLIWNQAFLFILHHFVGRQAFMDYHETPYMYSKRHSRWLLIFAWEARYWQLRNRRQSMVKCNS